MAYFSAPDAESLKKLSADWEREFLTGPMREHDERMRELLRCHVKRELVNVGDQAATQMSEVSEHMREYFATVEERMTEKLLAAARDNNFCDALRHDYKANIQDRVREIRAEQMAKARSAVQKMKAEEGRKTGSGEIQNAIDSRVVH